MRPHRYAAGARFYDILSGEKWVYRAGRVAGATLLGLRPGDTVLDLGCGTGLNFPVLLDAIGPHGRVIGLDRSSAMLAVAGRRVATQRWDNVHLVHADATDFSSTDLGLDAQSRTTSVIDAVFSTYAMSVFTDWYSAWDCARRVLKREGRACIVDMQVPTGHAAILAPLARLACAAGGSDIAAHPWTILERTGTSVSRRQLRGGHIQVVAATVP
ncbi:demethylmenaquinone methyltransferase/2-methoxy-6-polyprenyl-1,4-benzoquinol methylase [Mycetocola sp. CAN_C7]|uniref:class I SAM-dependent methyltransferase n=1 Tax=Mycetocola sp. CAN_C7 TaxID=2787724 RepID=UPI0018CB9321